MDLIWTVALSRSCFIMELFSERVSIREFGLLISFGFSFSLKNDDRLADLGGKDESERVDIQTKDK